jgi:hypothetical protein
MDYIINYENIKWKNIEELNSKYKKIVNNYFNNNNNNIKFNIINNILIINVDDWGIEHFYINNINENILNNDINIDIENIYKKISYNNLAKLDFNFLGNLKNKSSSNLSDIDNYSDFKKKEHTDDIYNTDDTNRANDTDDTYDTDDTDDTDEAYYKNNINNINNISNTSNTNNTSNINDISNNKINNFSKEISNENSNFIDNNIKNDLINYLKKNESKKYKNYIMYCKDITDITNIGLCIQIGNWQVFLEMEAYIDNLKKIEYNIYFVIIDSEFNYEIFEYLKNKYNNFVILIAPNKGMDIGLFLINLHYLHSNNINHDYLIKIHTKSDSNFRNKCIYNLIGSYDIIIENLKLLNKEDIGMISGNYTLNYNQVPIVFNNNSYYLNILSRYFYNNDIDNTYLEFAVGTFFIVNAKYFKIIDIPSIEYFYDKFNDFNTFDYHWYSIHYNLDINKKKYVLEHYNSNPDNYKNSLNYYIRTKDLKYRDYMIEHAYERFFGYIIKKNNLLIVPK